MVERLSPLEPAYRLGSHGRFEDGVGVILSETRPGSIVQIAAWPGEERQAIAAIRFPPTAWSQRDRCGSGGAAARVATVGTTAALAAASNASNPHAWIRSTSRSARY